MMTSQLFFENVVVGMEIGPLVKHPTSRQLVKWAGASEDFYEIHYDKDFALSTGLPAPIVHGRLKAAFLGQLMTDWAGEKGVVRKLSCTYRGMDLVGEDVICKGRVTQKYFADGANCIECEIWTENQKGERTTPGSAIVVLPSRG